MSALNIFELKIACRIDSHPTSVRSVGSRCPPAACTAQMKFPLRNDRAFLLLEWMDGWMDSRKAFILKATAAAAAAVEERRQTENAPMLLQHAESKDKQQYVEESAMENSQLRVRRLHAE